MGACNQHTHRAQGSLILTKASQTEIARTGACGFSTEGLGLGPGNPLGLTQTTESATEANRFAAWFEQLRDSLVADPDAKQPLLNALHARASHRSPALIYHLTLTDFLIDLADYRKAQPDQLETPPPAAFTAALALARQPATSMLSLYQGWIDTLQALEAARRTGAFVLLAEAGRRSARDRALRQCTELDARIKQLRAAAGREKQMPRHVELNLEIRRAEAERAAATEDL